MRHYKTLWSVETRPQREVLADLVYMCWPGESSILDPTYGHGSFYSSTLVCRCGGDRAHDRARDLVLDFTALPFASQAWDVVILDPPFQPATVDGIIGSRFTKPVKGINALERLVRDGVSEAYRVARRGIVVKLQDYIHNHKPVWMSSWARAELGEPYEVVHVVRRAKLRAANWGRQLSAYRNHSTFMVFSREKNR